MRLTLGLKQLVNMLKPFAIRMQPFIDQIAMKEEAIRDCADRATMENIRSVYTPRYIGAPSLIK